MAWDTDATKRKLLEAGARQFAAHGLAGARMDAIGRDAGVNKERVYRYFGDKARFFDEVLAVELGDLVDGLVLRTTGPSGVGEVAGALYDRYRARPELPRLLAWESLELPAPVGLERRCDLCAGITEQIRATLGIDRAAAEDLVIATISLATAAWTLSHVAATVRSSPAESHEARRAAIVAEVTTLATAAATARPAGAA
ncbi:TetR/AcrR family transcriptional regulator [Agromyces marinus]|nr:TetR/AcrR family transcriptional regulator [Agromyces marinus]UIP59588.1 hypothetical protein DSM26151_24990 [Agromyces marinus]